jgi:putative tricarboxylic transport membrane protein
LGVDTITSSPQGVMAPKGITAEQIKFWESAFRKVTQTKEWNTFLDQNQWASRFMTSEETIKMLDMETAVIEDVLNKLNIKKN